MPDGFTNTVVTLQRSEIVGGPGPGLRAWRLDDSPEWRRLPEPERSLQMTGALTVDRAVVDGIVATTPWGVGSKEWIFQVVYEEQRFLSCRIVKDGPDDGEIVFVGVVPAGAVER